MDKTEKKLLKIGIGGLNCPCCAPRKGTTARKKIIRTAIKDAKALALQEGLAELEEIQEEESELIACEHNGTQTADGNSCYCGICGEILE